MTTSTTNPVPPNGNGGEGDDLTRITGIAATREQWLKLIGIDTFQKLADASVEELESQLKAQGDNVSASEIEQWRAQAQTLAVEISFPTSETNQSTESSSEEERETSLASLTEEAEIDEPDRTQVHSPGDEAQTDTEAETETEASPTNFEETWIPLASFTVEFQSRAIADMTEHQTTVRHVQTNAVKTWLGIESEALQPWILERVNQVLASDAGTEPSAAKTPVTTNISQVRIFQPPRTEQPMVVKQAGQGISDSIKRDESFALEVVFDLAELNTIDLARQQVIALAQFYARHWSTGETLHLGNAEVKVLSQDEPPYIVLLSGTSLQQLGLYRLQVLVTLQGIPATPGYFEVPLLQVV